MKKFARRKLAYIGVPVALAALYAGWMLTQPQDIAPDDAPHFPKAVMTIQRADGSKSDFDVEVAATPEQEGFGLMFRRKLAPDAGMIFITEPDHVMIMWMKNTFIPLDMLFVTHDGRIDQVSANAVPLDLTPIRSAQPVHGVIEIGGGEAARQNIKPGDHILFPGFGGMN